MSRVLVLGGGGREHALCHHLQEHGHDVWCSPGNAGIEKTVPCPAPDRAGHHGVVGLARSLEVDFVLVGPEQPLVDGVADALADAGVACFGPSQAAATLEGSKAFMKDVCRAAGADTARFDVCATIEEARAALDAFGPGERVVIKADGLCGGKGVTIADNVAAARAVLDEYFGVGGPARFGDAGQTVVIESFLVGEELSVLGVCDGARALLLPVARDHKQLFDGGQGPNTGGMGAVAPLGPDDGIDAAFMARVQRDVFAPVLAEMSRRGAPYRGLLYAGLMWDRGTGRLAIVEFNVRFGDPEAQAVLFGLEQDLTETLLAVARGGDVDENLTLTCRPTCAVVVASAGYPGPAETGKALSVPPVGGDDAVFYAGVKAGAQGLVSSGGRVLACCARREDMRAAVEAAYALERQVTLDDKQVRRDIGASLL